MSFHGQNLGGWLPLVLQPGSAARSSVVDLLWCSVLSMVSLVSVGFQGYQFTAWLASVSPMVSAVSDCWWLLVTVAVWAASLLSRLGSVGSMDFPG